MSGTLFSLILPIVAIALALITKEVYLSLLIGVLSGAFLFTRPNPVHAVETVIAIMGDKIGRNVNILLFLSFFGIVVALITKSGASKAYGEWAAAVGSSLPENSGVDLVAPILILIVFCIGCMLYTGGILEGTGIVEAFANCDSALSLVLGSFFTLVFIFIFYLVRKVIRFNEFCESFTVGIKAMIPAILAGAVCGDHVSPISDTTILASAG